MSPVITIFTPTYNRAQLLPRLKQSLEQQSCFEFEWLIIDDGSIDETNSLVNKWLQEDLPFPLNYVKVPNGGKPRAINRACELAQTEWLFILDSDDYVTSDCVEFLSQQIKGIEDDKNMVGVGVLRGHDCDTPLRKVNFNLSINASNLERSKYGLDVDCNEVYRISVLRLFPFEVWPNEIFSPEAVVMNEMALAGYRLRWCNKICVISEYQEDGMTRGAWGLMKRNPMGYAMMWNHQIKCEHRTKSRLENAIHFVSQCVLAGEYRYILNCNAPLLLPLALFPGILLSIRRRFQYKEI